MGITGESHVDMCDHLRESLNKIHTEAESSRAGFLFFLVTYWCLAGNEGMTHNH